LTISSVWRRCEHPSEFRSANNFARPGGRFHCWSGSFHMWIVREPKVGGMDIILNFIFSYNWVGRSWLDVECFFFRDGRISNDKNPDLTINNYLQAEEESRGDHCIDHSFGSVSGCHVLRNMIQFKISGRLKKPMEVWITSEKYWSNRVSRRFSPEVLDLQCPHRYFFDTPLSWLGRSALEAYGDGISFSGIAQSPLYEVSEIVRIHCFSYALDVTMRQPPLSLFVWCAPLDEVLPIRRKLCSIDYRTK